MALNQQIIKPIKTDLFKMTYNRAFGFDNPANEPVLNRHILNYGSIVVLGDLLYLFDRCRSNR